MSIPCNPHSSAFPDKHCCAALPFCSPWPHLYPLRLTGLEFHTGSLLVLQVQSPVGPVHSRHWTLQ